MSSYSEDSGSFTLRIRSDALQTDAASAARLAPAERYSESVKPALRPADFWISTLAPSETHLLQRLGVMETRVSPIFISLGTPIFMRGSCRERRD
jgi:hypothetical protein